MNTGVLQTHCANGLQNCYPHRMPRPSHVRDAVTMQLKRAARHSWTVEEMQADLDASGVGADFSSVFRGLAWSESQGVVQRIDLGDGKARYELRGAHHEHLRCERCGTVTEVPGCLVEDSIKRLQQLTGFAVDTHRLVFIGLCRGCQ
jgi:Fur family ferric uptake transcriptional regulator